MLPIFPFVVGLVAGAFTVKLVRNEKAKERLGVAQEGLLKATVTGLSKLEQSTGRLRDRLASSVPASEAEAQPTETVKKRAPQKTPAKKTPARRTATAREPGKQ